MMCPVSGLPQHPYATVLIYALPHGALLHSCLQGQYSGIESFLTPPAAFQDCVHSDESSAEDRHHHDDCFKHVAPVKMLLAADHGQNNMGDASWLTDGTGFSLLDDLFAAPSNLIGPLWPGKQYDLPGAPVPVPIGNFVYGGLTGAGEPLWGHEVSMLQGGGCGMVGSAGWWVCGCGCMGAGLQGL